jgi:DNA modification methylase
MLYAQAKRFTLYHGDNREVLKELADNSIDSIVTDPPYELGFMGKSWDASGIAFNVEVWQECLRVLKPGGHLLAFSGSRTYHRMAVAIEDAGFEIRDQIMWIYGSGFPKSLDVSKAIDKAAGVEREITREEKRPAETGHPISFDMRSSKERERRDNPATTDAKTWAGWGTALKPAHEPIVVARKPLVGTVAANVLTYGTGGLNIDASRVSGEAVPINKLEEWSGFGQKIEPDYEQTINTQGRWPANVIHDGSDEVVELFPTNAGGGHWTKTKTTGFGEFGGGSSEYFGPGEKDGKGSAARFFYCAKANKRDRNEGVEASNNHPTVKPTDLMRYLCRLVTPPNGNVLDPFMGSGSTGKAAIYEGFTFVGIEMTDEYLPIAKARIEFAFKDENEKIL